MRNTTELPSGTVLIEVETAGRGRPMRGTASPLRRRAAALE